MKENSIRLFDILFSFIGLLIVFPVFIVLYIIIRAESKGGGFYHQTRIGKNGKEFTLLKFRTMRLGSDTLGLITIGGKDPRITKSGSLIRRFKLDELPQFFNVLKGEMSIVGPRPEVREWTLVYPEKWKTVHTVKPGITDYVSIDFINEEEILEKSPDPIKTYQEEILPKKLDLYLNYINTQTFLGNIKIIIKTIKVVLFK